MDKHEMKALREANKALARLIAKVDKAADLFNAAYAELLAHQGALGRLADGAASPPAAKPAKRG